MLSAVKRYKSLVTGALARCFPRTTAYLRDEDERVFRRWPDARPQQVSGRTAKAKGKAKAKKPARKPAAKPRKPAAEGIYAAAQLPIDEAQVQAMRAQVARAVTAGVVNPPSQEQWAMILGRSPVTRVFAGAGSGKSTTLLLRVVFMLCHLGIEPGRLTVISFTNASCAQLREQLIAVLAFWDYPFDAAQARQCVRTFHSAMAMLARDVLVKPVWFEQLADKTATDDEPDNALAATRLRPAQQRLLKQAYQRCYAEQADFRRLVHELLGLPSPADEPKGRRGAVKAPLDGFRLAGELNALPLYEPFMSRPASSRASAFASTGSSPRRCSVRRGSDSSSRRWFCSSAASRTICARRAWSLSMAPSSSSASAWPTARRVSPGRACCRSAIC
ncbi:helicase [Pseudomonas sp. BAY1663]|nr:helicase [Pseudomonas sp. BAY1663]